jgi:hypothetical protein
LTRPDGAAPVPPGVEHIREVCSLLIAVETADYQTVALIRRTTDHWELLSWALHALAAELRYHETDPAKWCRDVIARTIADEAPQ